MRKVAPSCWQWLNGLGSLLTACLLLFSAAQAAETDLLTWPKTYLTTDTPSGPGDTDFDQLGGYQGSPALVGTQPVFAFGPSYLAADCLAPLCRAFVLPPALPQQRVREYAVCFRQRLLKHQIAINAP